MPQLCFLLVHSFHVFFFLDNTILVYLILSVTIHFLSLAINGHYRHFGSTDIMMHIVGYRIAIRINRVVLMKF